MEEEAKERANIHDDDGDGVFDCGFMELLGCEDVVLEKREAFFFFSSPPYSSSSSSSSSSSPAGCFYPQMLNFGGGSNDEPFLLNHDVSFSGKSKAKPTKVKLKWMHAVVHAQVIHLDS